MITDRDEAQRLIAEASRVVENMRIDEATKASGMTFEESAQAVSIMSGEGPDATDAARQTLRQVVQSVGAAGAFTVATLRELGIEMDGARQILAERAAYIRKRWPSQLSDAMIAFAIEQGMTDQDIAGSLHMAATKKRRHQAHAQASRAWAVPSAGQKRSQKSKRRR